MGDKESNNGMNTMAQDVDNNCSKSSSEAQGKQGQCSVISDEIIGDDICRDFLKNICNRGSRCKYIHPKSIEQQRALTRPNDGIEYNFCIDYQNRGCHRENCRFIHAQREDAENYKLCGEVSLSLARAIAATYDCETINNIPICKEYQTGACSRGINRCRYWHINVQEERERRRRLSHTPVVLHGPQTTVTYDSSLSSASASLYPRRGASAAIGATPLSAQITSATVASLPSPVPPPAYVCDLYNGGSHSVSMHGASAYKRPRMDYDDVYIHTLERKNAELSTEVEGLKRELQRERERYEDLYALFRQKISQPTIAEMPSYANHRSQLRASSPTLHVTHYQNPSSWSSSHWPHP